MSRNAKTSNAPKPYCKVCQDAGKPESEYTSHWVKDRSGNTTCPTLLNTECRYCYKKGHTAKFCSVLAEKSKPKPQPKPVLKSKPKSNPPKIKMPANCFSALDASDDEEEIEVQQPTTYAPTGWAAVAAKQPEIELKIEEPINDAANMIVLKPRSQRTESYKAAPWANEPKPAKKSWAEMSDSEDEYEEKVYDDAW